MICPYQSKSMGKIWQSLGHIWPISGHDMGQYRYHMGLVWCLNLLNIEIWKTYGNKHIAINPMGNLWGYLAHR
jgi:hypothetical protein